MKYLRSFTSKSPQILCPLLLTLALYSLSFVAVAGQSETEPAVDKLAWVTETWRGEWRLDPTVDWNKFTKIQLDRATVDFRKNWVRDQKNRSGNRPTEKSITRLKSDLSEQLNEVFTRELTQDGIFTLSETGGEDVMRITPKIVELNVIAPDRMRDHIGYSLTDSKGSMTLELEIHDSVSGILIANAHDHREDRQNGWMEWTTAGANKRAAEFILSRWGRDLHDWLIEARTESQK